VQNISLSNVLKTDWTFLNLIPLDLGSDEPLISFYLDQGLLTDPVTLTFNCSKLRRGAQSLFQMVSPTQAPLADLGDHLGPDAPLASMQRLVQGCANSTITKRGSVDEINRDLFCTFDKVCRPV
jgi:hypothetical protein